ncbi:DUF3298 and DUF4163 domain-containing protein [Helicobacter winghamensis]|uniref:DUF3298 and DUF4163 domain-containing protein n=1 Tax=Helicobacter winghamensis TaxID=157268 RepID=UPI0018A500A6|nr:DUF3298 and DUF4163 domain-containing protein [Helicobacter winghamensis]QOQ98191.1 DUF3298 domain-containing protein [Helicobacter winghamensis]
MAEKTFLKKIITTILVLGICSYAKPIDFTYDTYKIENEKQKLFVSKNNKGILYAGSFDFGRCENKKDGIIQPLKNGELKCKNISLKVRNAEIIGILKNGKFQHLNLKLEQSFKTQEQVANFTYTGKSNNSATITTKFQCSKDPTIQKILEKMYGIKFNCKNGISEINKIAKKSLLKDTESIDTILSSSAFEEQSGDFLYYFDEEFLSFDTYNYIYTSGAHGNHTRSGITISKNGDIIPLADILTPSNKPLKDFLWKEYQKFAKEMRSEPLIKYEEFNISNSILLDYGEVLFLYQPYELMPYSYGVITLKIPFEAFLEFTKTKNSPLELIKKQIPKNKLN